MHWLHSISACGRWGPVCFGFMFISSFIGFPGWSPSLFSSFWHFPQFLDCLSSTFIGFPGHELLPFHLPCKARNVHVMVSVVGRRICSIMHLLVRGRTTCWHASGVCPSWHVLLRSSVLCLDNEQLFRVGATRAGKECVPVHPYSRFSLHHARSFSSPYTESVI